MGATQSKEVLLYQGVQNGNHDAVKSLRRDGASLEWVDKEGRTPLILACMRGELLDMVITLLNLGANMNAYKPGAHGGYPLHHAAKRGLDKTVTLLLSHGADPLAKNDDGHTPLDMARSRGHASVVRLLEEHLSEFCGMLREVSGLAILESLVPHLVTKKVWVVLLQNESRPRRGPAYELAIYESPKVCLWNGRRASSTHPAGLCNVPQPKTTIPLAKAEIEEPNFNSSDPVLYITDKTHKTKYKFLSGNKGDNAQLERLYQACRRLTQNGRALGIGDTLPTAGHSQGSQGNPSQIHPISSLPSTHRQPILQSVSAPASDSHTKPKIPAAETIPEELALALALDESIRTATEEGIPLSPDMSRVVHDGSDYKRWDVADGFWKDMSLCDSTKQHKLKESDYSGWKVEQKVQNAGPSGLYSADSAAGAVVPPSAPPLHYPTLAEVSTAVQHAGMNSDRTSGMCVVCWDAPTEGACIPCGHLAGCMNCLKEIKSKRWGCPVCRCEIGQIIKVYAV